MTEKEYEHYDAAQQKIVVAGLNGWRRHTDNFGIERWVNQHDDHAYRHEFSAIPDYLNDLNACHEFENRMDLDGRIQVGENTIKNPLLKAYWFHLQDIVKTRGAYRATAAQRCKAFVLARTGGQQA